MDSAATSFSYDAGDLVVVEVGSRAFDDLTATMERLHVRLQRALASARPTAGAVRLVLTRTECEALAEWFLLRERPWSIEVAAALRTAGQGPRLTSF
jgi:hypothetical protein